MLPYAKPVVKPNPKKLSESVAPKEGPTFEVVEFSCPVESGWLSSKLVPAIPTPSFTSASRLKSLLRFASSFSASTKCGLESLLLTRVYGSPAKDDVTAKQMMINAKNEFL